MTTMRVDAVGNALFAFSKEFVDAVCGPTTPAASTRALTLPMSLPRGFDPPRAFIESSQPNRAEVQIPFAVVDRFEANGFTDQDRTHDGGFRVPPHHAGRRHAPQL